MGYKFNAEEFQEAIRVARIYNDGIKEEDFHNLLEMQRHLKESGYLEGVEGIAILEADGVSCTNVLTEFQARKKQSSDLSLRISTSQEKLQELAATRQKAEEENRQIQESIQQAKKELDEVRSSKSNEEQELAAFRLKAAQEKEKMEQELAECRRRNEVNQVEVDITAKLKKELVTHGFSLELIFSLAEEFGIQKENARQELTAAIQKHGLLHNANAALEQQGRERKKVLLTEVNAIKTDREAIIKEIQSLRETDFYLKNHLDQVQQNLEYEAAKEKFYLRYQQAVPLLECLATWDQIFFLRCNSNLHAMAGYFNPAMGNAVFWTDKPASVCPHCGLKMLTWDQKAYQALGLPPGGFVKINLQGE